MNVIPIVDFSDSISNTLFEIRGFEEIQNSSEQSHDVPHRHDYVEMIWITQGDGSFSIDFKNFDITNNQLFCILPGQVHQLHLNSGSEGFVVSFAMSFLNSDEYDFGLAGRASIFELIAKAKGIVFKGEVLTEINEIFIKMLKEFTNNYPLKLQLLKRYLKILFIHFTREVEVAATKRNKNVELIENFFELVNKNFKKNKLVLEYANQLYVTPNYLNEIVKKYTGSTAGDHIRQRIVLEAKRLAHYSNLCMKEIAYELDFADSAHFSKFFKSVTGSNFTDFKREKLTLSIAI